MSKNIILKNVNIIDGKLNSSILENKDIIIEDGKIIKIGENLSGKGKILDLKGKYVLPGLINLHAHTPSSGKVSKKKLNDNKKLVKFVTKNNLTKKIALFICKSTQKQALLSGVTTVRCVGGLADVDSILRDKINSGKVCGPRLICANNAIGVVGGHMDGTVSVGVNTDEEAVALAKKQLDTGADFLKIMITGGILDTEERGKPGVLKMPASMVKAVCDFAHENGKIVAAHIEGPEGMESAILNGVDTFEHSSEVSEELLLKLKARKGAIIPTLSPAIPFYYLDPEIIGYGEAAQYNTKIFMEKMVNSVNNCLKMGIKVGLGADTGCPYVTHYGFYRELIYFNKFIKGASPELVIHLATLGNAEIAGIDKITGSIEEGKLAELLVVKENPINNLNTLGESFMVLKDGKVFTKKVKKYKNVETTLDSIVF